MNIRKPSIRVACDTGCDKVEKLKFAERERVDAAGVKSLAVAQRDGCNGHSGVEKPRDGGHEKMIQRNAVRLGNA